MLPRRYILLVVTVKYGIHFSFYFIVNNGHAAYSKSKSKSNILAATIFFVVL